MGHRANLIIGTAGRYELYYSHWRANTLDRDLFWGPECASVFVRRQRSAADGAEWLDEVWAEGGAVIDPVRRELVWFGGEDVGFDVPRRRVHMALMRELWPGWEIRWAHEHLCDLATQVGRGYEDLLLTAPHESAAPISLPEPQERDWISVVLSARCDGTWKLHALDAMMSDLPMLGPQLATAMFEADLPSSYDFANRTSDFPIGGLHFDEGFRRVEVWNAWPSADFDRRLRAAWPGWDVRWHRDDFEAMTRLLGERLVLPTRATPDVIADIRASVLSPPQDRSGLVADLARGDDVDINAFALRDVAPAPGGDQARAFDEAAARVLEHASSIN